MNACLKELFVHADAFGSVTRFSWNDENGSVLEGNISY
jgi:hypothetical protein